MADNLGLWQHLADVMVTLSALFDPSPEGSFTQFECRLVPCWKSLVKIKTYEEVCSPASRAGHVLISQNFIETSCAVLTSY